ncbi:hypothetical protein LTR37_013474 [Vermiconidia calcicola]|uniref:Uncharacterized protein n=1 Tax=Vermiconidia calcicola TaxID=1690605 RepID=A0ACC3MWF8_9PEZI|nr:hypothetical protein LTR37_013474 [Vermiconidia calcicola]
MNVGAQHYEIRRAGAKGLGVFATKLIPRGTRILAERPLFTVKSDRDLYPALRSLAQNDRDHLKQLSISGNRKPSVLDWAESTWHFVRGALSRSPAQTSDSSNITPAGRISLDDYKTFLATFRNNNFNIGNGTRATFRDISRVNHSCVPNTQGNFNSAIGCFTVHAVRPIDQEQEITISYLDEHGAVRGVRQGQLFESYGFECNCPVCEPKTSRGRESERRRTAVRERLMQYAETASQRRETDLKMELELLLMLIRMLEEEGIVGRELATMYLSAAEGSLKVGDRKAAQRYSELGLEMDGVCLGTDSPLFKESLQRMRSIPRA